MAASSSLPFFNINTKTTPSLPSDDLRDLSLEQLQEAINHCNTRIEHCNETLQNSYSDIDKKKEKIEKLKSDLEGIQDEKRQEQMIELINLMQAGVIDLEKELTEISKEVANIISQRNEAELLVAQAMNGTQTTSSEESEKTNTPDV